MHRSVTLLVVVTLFLPAAFAAGVSEAILKSVARSYSAKEPASGVPLGLVYDDAVSAQQHFVDLLIPKLGPVAGYKVGLVTPAGQKRFGIDHPVWGVLLKGMLLPNASTVPAGFGTRPILEADLIVRVKDDGINNAATIQEAARHLSEVVTFIELADNLFATNPPIDAGVLVAGNVGARSGILGQTRRFEPTDEFVDAFGKMSIVLKKNGQELSRVSAEGILGHPLNAVLWLVQDMKRHGARLKPGDVLSLGSPSPQETPRSGESYTLIYEGLPGGPTQASVKIE